MKIKPSSFEFYLYPNSHELLWWKKREIAGKNYFSFRQKIVKRMAWMRVQHKGQGFLDTKWILSICLMLALLNVSYVCRRNVSILQRFVICFNLVNTHTLSYCGWLPPGLLWELKQHSMEPARDVASCTNVGTHHLSQQTGLNSDAVLEAICNCIISW